MTQYGVDPRKHEWEPGQVQERKKGIGMEKWYDEAAVRAKVSAAEPVPVAVPIVENDVIVEVVPALLSPEPETAPESGEYVEVKVAKKAMNYRFVIGCKGEVVRVQDNARIKVGMKLIAKRNERGQYDTKEVVR
jgi:hypothetical protein